MNDKQTQPQVQRTTEQRADQRRPQRRSRAAQEDRFYIEPGLIPLGMDWQWNRYSVLGKEDTENLIMMQEDGWTAVTWSKLPEMKRPPNMTERGLKDPVIRGGMILMERPMELTQEARAEDRQAADDQVQTKLTEVTGSAPPETMTRSHPGLKNHITRSFGPAGIPVPEE